MLSFSGTLWQDTNGSMMSTSIPIALLVIVLLVAKVGVWTLRKVILAATRPLPRWRLAGPIGAFLARLLTRSRERMRKSSSRFQD